MIVGFTGTEKGMTSAQKQTLCLLLDSLDVTEFHHGDCVGADAEAHEIALDRGIRIVIHPPTDSKKRAFCKGAVEIREPKPYLDRNHDIVDEGDGALIATPFEEKEILRSGTWATVRYAYKMGRAVDVFVIRPEGWV